MSKPARSTPILLVLALLMWCSADLARAGSRWIDDTLSTDLQEVLADPTRDRIYVSDPGSSDVVVLGSRTERVLARIAVPRTLTDLAISKDGRYLAAGTSFAIVRIDLQSLEPETFALPAPFPSTVQSLTFDAGGRLIILGWRSHAYVIDLEAGEVVQSFGWGQHSWPFPIGHVETDATGETLWIVSSYSNPSRVFEFDVSDPHHAVPVGDTHTDHEIGSFARDFAVGPDGRELYLAPGNPYGVQVLEATSLSLVGFLPGILGPSAVTLSPSGRDVFFPVGSVYSSDRIFHYGTGTRELLFEYFLEDRVLNDLTRPRGLAVDHTGRRLYVAHGNSSQFNPSSVMLVIDLGREVGIDIRPGSTSNRIHPGSRGLVPVAVLSAEEFDAALVDPQSLTFGPSEATVSGRRWQFRDVDGDGRLDLFVAFRSDEAGIQCGDEVATVRGMGPDGHPFFGRDALVTVGCPRPVAAR
jgi:DNA-binding beta-propeller fold protein YncE